MGKCAYCKQEKRLTREHLLPDWYLKIDPSPEDTTFLERAKDRFISSDPVIKDVCAECNNVRLSQLDKYGKSVYTSTLSHFIYRDEPFSLNFDYTRFVKWLIKIAYNSARIHGTDIHVLEDYASILVDQSPLPEHLRVFVTTITPSVIDAFGNRAMAKRCDSAQACNPSWFRTGVFRIPEFDSISWSFRHVTINSFCFFLCVPQIGCETAYKEESQLLASAKKGNTLGVMLSSSGVTELPAASIDALTYSLAHIAAFPFSYNLIHNEVAKKVIDDEFDVVHYVIAREDIESKNTKELFEFITDITGSREIALGFSGKVEFSILGYEEDQRELYEIADVRNFLRIIDDAFPYWMLFQYPHGTWLKSLTFCLCDGERSDDNLVSLDADQMERLVHKWFVALNEVSHKFALTMETNRKLSDSATAILFEPDA